MTVSEAVCMKHCGERLRGRFLKVHFLERLQRRIGGVMAPRVSSQPRGSVRKVGEAAATETRLISGLSARLRPVSGSKRNDAEPLRCGVQCMKRDSGKAR